MTVAINREQKLFVIESSGGYSCLGFDVLYQRLRQLVSTLGLRMEVREDEKGTIGQYADYQRAVTEASRQNLTQTWFSEETPIEVRRILERYRKLEKPIRLWYGDAESGRDWMEETDVIGCIGRSTGTFKIPLLLADSMTGGPAISDSCIVKIADTTTRKVLWVHPHYHLPTLHVSIDKSQSYPYAALADGQIFARFKTYGKASQWVAFMCGECMELPV